MDLLSEFQGYLRTTLQIGKQDKILLAVSGGRDSMLMCHLFQAAGYNTVIAHCNFQLRAAESDKDEALVRDYAQASAIPFYVAHFETEDYAQQRGISIQMAARELRYTWFEELRASLNADWIALAQHLNDHIETVLVNLTRGTGLLGLQGILPKRDRLIRPLLFMDAEAVLAAVRQEGIPYRDDASNFSNKYARNKIRLDIIPKFKEIAPDFEAIMERNIQHFQEAQGLLESFLTPIRERLFSRSDTDLIQVERAALAPYLENLPLLYALFRPYNFSKALLSDLQMIWLGESGRVFASESHELLMDRAYLFIRPLVASEKQTAQRVTAADRQVVFGDQRFFISYSSDTELAYDAQVAQIDADLLIFPLTLRYWEEGDVFVPLGMQGRKKLSDFFIQQKLTLFAKKQVPILVNGNGEIVWLVSYRLDNRYKMTESTKKVFTLVVK